MAEEEKLYARGGNVDDGNCGRGSGENDAGGNEGAAEVTEELRTGR